METRISSLILQIVLYFNGWYLVLMYLAEVGLLIYKGIVLPYPSRNFWPELVLLLLIASLDCVRLFTGAKGNLTARKIPLLLSLLFILPLFFGYLYFILWQTYVLTAELVLLVIANVGLILHLVLAPVVLLVVYRNAAFQ